MNFSANNGSDQGTSIDYGSIGAVIRSPGRDWITARIGKSKKVILNEVEYWLHAWKELLVKNKNGLAYEDKEGGDYGSVPYTGFLTISIKNPIVTLPNAILAEGTKVFARQRVPHEEYGYIYECITGGSSGSGPVQSVQCTNNILVVTYN